MAAYLIFTRHGPVRNEEEMKIYKAKNAANSSSLAEKHPMRPLAFYGPTEAMEGANPDGVVLLEFPNADEARAWYNSPEYQEALPHRLKAACYSCTLIEGI